MSDAVKDHSRKDIEQGGRDAKARFFLRAPQRSSTAAHQIHGNDTTGETDPGGDDHERAWQGRGMKQHIEHRIRKEERKAELVPIKTIGGEAKAWDAIAELRPRDVCAGAGVGYDPSSRAFTLRSFGIDFTVSPDKRTITSSDPRSGLFLDRYRDFFRLSVLYYLTSAKDIPATERLIRPLDVKGGQRFFSGTHVLPLDQVAERFGRDKVSFVAQGLKFGAEIAAFGDAAVRLTPLPRVPVTVILYLQDEEYPARVTLFFDSTVDFQLPLSDIVWSVSMMATLVMAE